MGALEILFIIIIIIIFNIINNWTNQTEKTHLYLYTVLFHTRWGTIYAYSLLFSLFLSSCEAAVHPPACSPHLFRLFALCIHPTQNTPSHPPTHPPSTKNAALNQTTKQNGINKTKWSGNISQFNHEDFFPSSSFFPSI